MHQQDPAQPPHFDDAGRLVAPRYDDLYFSRHDGLAETTHVFLDGNGLAERFASLSPGETFTVGETGFGTGLNFLACWRLFESKASKGACLRYVSVEKEPLDAGTIRQALTPWPGMAVYVSGLLAAYEPPRPGTHRYALAGGQVELNLLVGEVAAVLAGWEEPADAWFLDGFAPSRNPAMWSDEVFAQVARLSKPGATLATYTAAGLVRRGLMAAGFDVAKQPGFGTKRDMTVGRLTR